MSKHQLKYGNTESYFLFYEDSTLFAHFLLNWSIVSRERSADFALPKIWIWICFVHYTHYPKVILWYLPYWWCFKNLGFLLIRLWCLLRQNNLFGWLGFSLKIGIGKMCNQCLLHVLACFCVELSATSFQILFS